ncbi:MAG: hypothetical protein QXU52_05000 [Fervidicoccaceae archaeon]
MLRALLGLAEKKVISLSLSVQEGELGRVLSSLIASLKAAEAKLERFVAFPSMNGRFNVYIEVMGPSLEKIKATLGKVRELAIVSMREERASIYMRDELGRVISRWGGRAMPIDELELYNFFRYAEEKYKSVGKLVVASLAMAMGRSSAAVLLRLLDRDAIGDRELELATRFLINVIESKNLGRVLEWRASPNVVEIKATAAEMRAFAGEPERMILFVESFLEGYYNALYPVAHYEVGHVLESTNVVRYLLTRKRKE